MRPGSTASIIISALVLSVHSLPSDIDWSTLQYDPDSVAQNEKILRLFLQLAVHTADRLMRLRNETDKDHDCKGQQGNLPLSTIAALATPSSSQVSLERPDKTQQTQDHSSFGDYQINNNDRISLEDLNRNQTALLYSTQELLESSDTQKTIDGRNIVSNPNSKASDLIPKFVQDVQNTPSDVIGSNHEIFHPGTLRRSVLASNTTNNSLNANEFSPDARNFQNAATDGVSKRLLHPIDPMKNVLNTTVINDITETVNKFLSKPQNLQESTLGVSQRLYGGDLVKNIADAKITSDLHENVNRRVPWPLNTQEPSDGIDGVSQRFFDTTMVKNFGNIFNPQALNNLPAGNQILSNAKNIVDSMNKTIPEETRAESLPIKADISKAQSSNDRFIPDPLIDQKDFSAPLLRSLPDFDEHKSNDEKAENDFAPIQTNESANISTDEKPSIRNHQETYRHSDRVNEEIKPEGFEETNETRTDYKGKRLNPISEDLSQKDGETGSKVETLTSSNQLEFDASTISSVTGYQNESSNDAQDVQDSGDNTANSDLEKLKKLQNDPSANDRKTIEKNRNNRIDNNLSESSGHSRIIDDSKGENVHKQLSEAKLREISDRLINVLRPVIEKGMANSRDHMIGRYSGQWDKSLPSSNVASNFR